MIVRALLCLLPLVIATSALAQEEAPPPPGWDVSAELGLVATSGNSDSSSFGVGSEILFDDGLWNNRGRIRYIQVENEGERTAESLDGLLHFARAVGENLEAFGEASYMRNRFAGVEHRSALASGLTWTALETERRKLELSAGLGYTVEQRVEQPDRDFATALGLMLFRHEFSERSSFENISDLNLNLERGEDWRGRNVAALVAGLTDIVSVKLALDVRYQNEPVPGFERTDTITSAALVAKF